MRQGVPYADIPQRPCIGASPAGVQADVSDCHDSPRKNLSVEFVPLAPKAPWVIETCGEALPEIDYFSITRDFA